MYALSVDPGIFGERIAIVLGFVTLAMALTVFASCRSCLSFLRIFHIKNVLDSKGYKIFYRYHNYYWWIFGYVLIVHIWMALVHTGFPVAGDPDGGIHWVILGFAFGSVISVATVISSCRSFVYLLTFFRGKNPLVNNVYKAAYKFHAYYWMVFILAIAGHFAAAYFHAGLWPGG